MAPTPELGISKSFSPTSIDPNGISTITISISNGISETTQTGINFSDILPAGLVIAPTPNVTISGGWDLPLGTVTAVAGTGTISFSGGILPATDQLGVITVDVTGASAGTYLNSVVAHSDQVADSLPATATLTINALPIVSRRRNKISAPQIICFEPNKFGGVFPPTISYKGSIYVKIGKNCYAKVR